MGKQNTIAQEKIGQQDTLRDIANTSPDVAESHSIKNSNKISANKGKSMGWKGKLGAFVGVAMAADAAYSMLAGGNKMPEQQYQDQPSFFGQP